MNARLRPSLPPTPPGTAPDPHGLSLLVSHIVRGVAPLAVAAMVLSPTVSLTAAPDAGPTVASLGWLEGTWTLQRDERTVTEIWMAPAGGTMLGMSRTVVGARTTEYEFIVLRPESDGTLVYVAKPSGQPEATFRLVRLSGREAVFENPAHDFPQRIIYARHDDEHLLAVVEGVVDGRERRLEFPYRRVAP